jgi:hypothetical protein
MNTMNYLIPGAGLVLILIILMFFVIKTLRQTGELRFALGSSKRKIHEISRRIKEMEALDPDELTEADKNKLAHLGNLLQKLSRKNGQE